MRTLAEDRQYLHNLATTMIQQLHISPEEAAPGSRVQDIYEKFGEPIKTKLFMMTAETRGRIADLGLSRYNVFEPEEIPMYSVHCKPWLDEHQSGHNLLVEIACTAIVAKMAEILWKKWTSWQPTSAEEEIADIYADDPID